MKVYLAGQTNFGNRGCEALVRSTAFMLNNLFSGIEVLCPLTNINRDADQWQEAKKYGVSYVSSPKFPKKYRWWARANRLLPIEGLGIPKYSLDKDTLSHIQESSVVIMTGGDNITLDYGVMALYQWSGMIEQTINMGIPAVLWAASVGPFNQRPGVEKIMIEHLKKYKAITVRESVSLSYLQSLGLKNVELASDPAFLLKPEIFDISQYIKDKDRPLLGLNMSPLIRKRSQNDNKLDKEIMEFLKRVINETNFSVILISHVDNDNNHKKNSDWHYLHELCNSLLDKNDRIILAPPFLNAGQVKYLIGTCKYFIGARTHSTIAALSQCIPTVSIAYSIKAIGINEDLFGHKNYVINTSEVTSDSLMNAMTVIQSDRDRIREILKEKIPEWQKRAYRSVISLKRVLDLE